MKKKRARQVKRANKVFLDLGFPPHEAAVMLLRCELAEALHKWMDHEAISQVEAARRLGVVQPRIPEIARNRLTTYLWTISSACVEGWCLSCREIGRLTTHELGHLPRGV